MATVNITEYKGQLKDHNGLAVAAIDLATALAGYDLVFAGATPSNPLNAQTSIIRLVTDTDCRVLYSTSEVAVTSGLILIAGIPEYFGITLTEGYILSFVVVA